MSEALISWAATVAAVYALLLATYAASCLVVGRLNRRLAAAKIQAPPDHAGADPPRPAAKHRLARRDRGDVRHRPRPVRRIRLGLGAAARNPRRGAVVRAVAGAVRCLVLLVSPADPRAAALCVGASLASSDGDPGRLVQQQRPADRQSVPAILLAGGAFPGAGGAGRAAGAQALRPGHRGRSAIAATSMAANGACPRRRWSASPTTTSTTAISAAITPPTSPGGTG